MLKIRKWTASLYVVILTFFVMVFSYLVLSNMEIMSNDMEVLDLSSYESKVLSKNAYLNLEYNLSLNKDWNWFLDNNSCPSINFFLTDWTSLSLNSEIFFKEEWTEKKVYCKAENSWTEILLYFSYNDLSLEQKKSIANIFQNNSWVIFSKMFYGSEEISLNNSLSWNFSLWTFTIWQISWTDNLDDNLNSDNFKISSKDDILYPNNFFDNDSDARKNILWLILLNENRPNIKRINIFANTEETNKVISENKNNILPSQKLPDLENATFNIKFSKNINWKLEIVKILKTNLEKTSSEINLNNINNIEVPNLDFKNNFYYLFLESDEQLSWISYKIFEKSWAYINPIYDDYDDKIEIYQTNVFNHNWTDILISKTYSLKK